MDRVLLSTLVTFTVIIVNEESEREGYHGLHIGDWNVLNLQTPFSYTDWINAPVVVVGQNTVG